MPRRPHHLDDQVLGVYHAPPDPRFAPVCTCGHGIALHAFGVHGCRCETCRAAKATYMRTKRRDASRARKEAGSGEYVVDGISHGISGYQNHSCRCLVCRAAYSDAWLRSGTRARRMAS